MRPCAPLVRPLCAHCCPNVVRPPLGDQVGAQGSGLVRPAAPKVGAAALCAQGPVEHPSRGQSLCASRSAALCALLVRPLCAHSGVCASCAPMCAQGCPQLVRPLEPPTPSAQARRFPRAATCAGELIATAADVPPRRLHRRMTLVPRRLCTASTGSHWRHDGTLGCLP